MITGLLYRNRDPERAGEGAYADAPDIIKDLGLERLFRTAGSRLIRDKGQVIRVDKEDPWVTDTVRRVMSVPLSSREEIVYRQEIIRDALGREELMENLYRIGRDTLKTWDVLGRGVREKVQQRNPVTKLIADIQALELVCDALGEIRGLFEAADEGTGKPVIDGLSSEGLRGFYERLCAAFSREKEATVRQVLEDVSFFTGGGEESRPGTAVKTLKPRIVLECGLEDGLKFSSLKLAEAGSEQMRFYRPGTTMKKLQELIQARPGGSFSVERDPILLEQAKQLEFGVVRHLIEEGTFGMLEEFRTFFDQLKLQAAFYLGAVQLLDYMKFYGIPWCFPEAGERESLRFRALREFVMGLEWRRSIVGNTCDLDGTELLIVTGANQGGKSTFLRSIGIAQVMMQCGMPVAAEEFRSGLFPRIFVHFTRREDSSMNSGRLEEELKRMNRIIEQVGEGTLILLNESFATTTEKEGSVIAWDITRALKEAGVRILMVTHLLSFANRVREAAEGDPDSKTTFLTAERKTDGTRTFRMIPHVPEMTSFGLDLYEEIVEGRKAAGR